MTKSSYEIEKNIPIPKLMYGGAKTKYPWREIKVRESFFIASTASRPFSMSAMNKRLAPKKFISRKAVKDGVDGFRIWRVK